MTAPPKKLSVASWVVYDLANTLFSMGVISLLFPLWVREVVGQDRADATQSLIMGISMSIIFILSPILGAMSDCARRRMPFLVTATLICIAMTLLLGRLGFFVSAICFIIANAAFQAGVQFYDALLPSVSNEKNRGKIGGIGVGIGYVGSYIAVGMTLVFPEAAKPNLFFVIGILFLAFACPCFFFVQERGNPNPQPINVQTVGRLVRRTIRTLKSTRDYPGLARFLIGRVFYTDAINTVIMVMALFTVNVAMASGLDETQGQKQASIIMMTAITFSIFGGFFWGYLADRIGPKATLNWVLGCWIGIFLITALTALLALPIWMMFVVGCTAGFGLGGMIAADRPLMLCLSPPERIGEFYGLYGMVGRFAAIIGPAIWFLTMNAAIALGLRPLQGQGVGVLILMVLVIISMIILKPVSDQVHPPKEPSAPSDPNEQLPV